MNRMRDRVIAFICRRATIVACIALLGAAYALDADSAVLNYGAVLSSAQEFPTNVSTAIGGGRFTIDTDANTVTYRISFTGLVGPETSAHIHGVADPGANAGVLQALPVGNPKVGVWNYLEAQEADILAGRTYANIHSSAFPGGEIRGQIVSHNALLDGAQEVPVVVTAATGWGVFVIDTVANQLKYHVVFSGLSSAETAAHIHGFTLHGTGAGVLVGLALGSPKTGVWNYLEAQEEGILAGRTYVNIHSVNFPGGEIRGQIVPIVVPMDGAQEFPANGSAGAGVGLIAYDLNTDNLSFDVRFAGLSGAETAAHIHGYAPPGANAGVLLPLPLGSPKFGVWPFGAANETNVTNGLAYLNIHSAAFPGGEIRGQIIGFPSSVVAVSHETPPPAMSLAPGAPNPFQSTTRISFRLDRPSVARLAVYDTQGRLVRDLAAGDFAAGEHAFRWDGATNDGRRVASGIYRYVLHTPRGDVAGRVTLLK
jgi:hypothetical protein